MPSLPNIRPSEKYAFWEKLSEFISIVFHCGHLLVVITTNFFVQLFNKLYIELELDLFRARYVATGWSQSI
jgi:hypothetical protein